jgi:hypothetical protein
MIVLNQINRMLNTEGRDLPLDCGALPGLRGVDRATANADNAEPKLCGQGQGRNAIPAKPR